MKIKFLFAWKFYKKKKIWLLYICLFLFYAEIIFLNSFPFRFLTVLSWLEAQKRWQVCGKLKSAKIKEVSSAKGKQVGSIIKSNHCKICIWNNVNTMILVNYITNALVTARANLYSIMLWLVLKHKPVYW